MTIELAQEVSALEAVAVIDFETTGLSPAQGDRATEIAVVILHDGQVVDRYQSLMNAGVRIPSYIQELTGISDAMIRSAPPVAEVMREVSAFVGDTPLVAHNASFDCNANKVVVLPRGWDRRDQFLQGLRQALERAADRPAYYPGARERFERYAGGQRGSRFGRRCIRGRWLSLQRGD